MKLAECLLQDRPIRRKKFNKWCKPEIVMSNISSFASLPTVCGTDKYTLDYTNMTAEDWEIKTEPLRVEFECRWRHCPEFDYYYPAVDISEFIDIVNLEKSGKRFKVTCEEIEG